MRGDGSGRAPETVDEIPWGDPPEPTIATSTPRKCRHPRERRTALEDGGWKCVCGHEVAGAKMRRGRAIRKLGKAAELRDARALGLEPRGTSRDPEDAGGAMDPAVLQSKTGPGHASAAWIRELEALEGVARNRPRILLATEKPGRGSRPGGSRHARRLVVMFEDEFVRLTGLDARRKNLEALAEYVERQEAAGAYVEDYEAQALLAALRLSPAR